MTVNVENPVPRVRAEAVRKDIPCNFCGSDNPRPFRPGYGRGLVQCQQCGLIYVSPRPADEELYALYGETYFKSGDSRTVGYTDYLSDERNIRKTFAERLKRVERDIAPPGRLLDVGCSMGFFMAEAEKHGWEVQGSDVSAFAVEHTRTRFGFDARHGSFLELDYPAGAYDLISMWDVIEHVPDPMAHLHKAAALLRPGGVLVISTPNVESLPARLARGNWVGYKLSEEHVYYFSKRMLAKMLDRAGFDVLNARHIGKYVTVSLFLDRFGMYFPSLARLLQFFERRFGLSEWSLSINPFDIVCITARKR